MAKWPDLTQRARELADRERRLYDQRELPAVLEELAAENEALRAEAARLRAEAEKSAAQRDEAVLRATQAEEAKRAVEADLEARLIHAIKTAEHAAKGWEHWLVRGMDAEAELARIRSDRQKGEAL